METQLGQPAAAPDPVAGYRVNHQGDHQGVDAVGDELGALSHGAGDDGGRRGAEDSLENKERRQGHTVRKYGGIVSPHHGIKAADQGARPAEHQPEAHRPVDRGTDAKVHEVFH